MNAQGLLGSSHGGVVVHATRQWPRTDENCLPGHVRVAVDADKNGMIDHIASVAVALVDRDGDGVWRRDIDGVMLDPDRLERIDSRVRLGFTDAQWREVVKRAAAGL